MRSGLEARRTISGGMSEFSRRGGLKQPPTVVAQFQVSKSSQFICFTCYSETLSRHTVYMTSLYKQTLS